MPGRTIRRVSPGFERVRPPRWTVAHGLRIKKQAALDLSRHPGGQEEVGTGTGLNVSYFGNRSLAGVAGVKSIEALSI